MVNVGWNSASILGVFLAVAGAGLYFLRSVRPELSRDYDIFFSCVGLICGLILVFNGWRLDPILQFGQFALAISTFFFAFETLRLRGLATEQAKRSTPIVDDERPVSRAYRAYRDPEYDELEPYRDPDYEPPRKRLRGSDDYETAEPPRRARTTRTAPPPERRPSSSRRSRPEPPPPSRPPARENERYSERYDEWGEAWTEEFDEPELRESRRSRRPRRDEQRDERPTRPASEAATRQTPARQTAVYEDEEPAPYVDYVDYQPDAPADDLDTPDDRDFGNGEREERAPQSKPRRDRFAEEEEQADDYPEERRRPTRSRRDEDFDDDEFDY